MPEVCLHAGGGLVAIFGSLGKKLQDYGCDWRRDPFNLITWRFRLACDVAMNPFHRAGRVERKSTSQHLVKGDAERIEVATCIDGPVHPAGLLRRHILQTTGSSFGCNGRDPLPRQ